MITEVTKENFSDEVLNSGIPVVVDFWAEWCAPCKMMSPIFDQLHDELKSKVKFCKIDVDSNQDIAQKYAIMSIPAIFLFKDGEVANQVVGVTDAEQLKRKFEL